MIYDTKDNKKEVKTKLLQILQQLNLNTQKKLEQNIKGEKQ